MGHDAWLICMFTFVLRLAWLCRPTDSFPIFANESLRMSSHYDSPRFSGRKLKAFDWETCEFGDTYQPYDEKCENGANGLLPCNPGQLKVAECIGQDGDLSRICEPCPQKYYQSSYNKCTACHPCSECGPNERIMQACTDEMDTVCERIIQPPQPPAPPTTTTTTTTPSDVTEAPGQSPSTQPVARTSSGPTTFVSSPKEATGKTSTTGEPTSGSTTQNVTAKPPGTVRNRDSEIYIGIAVLAILGWISFILLLGVHCYCRGKQKKKLKEERRRYHELNQRLAAFSSKPTSLHPVGQSDHDASDSVSKGANGSARHESAVDGCRGSSEAQRIDPLVDNPEDEKSLLSKVFGNLTNHLPSFVAKDSSGKKKKPSHRVTFHSKATGDHQSTSDHSVSFASGSLASEHRKDIPRSADSSSAESLKSDDAVNPVGRRSSGNPQPCNGGHISMATAVVHSDGDDPGGSGCGDGESLVMDSIVHDGRSSHGVDPRDPRLRDNHTGQQHSRDSNSSIDRDLHWPAEKVPASGREVPPLDSNERWHAEKIPGSSALPPSSMKGNVSYEDGPPTDVPPVYAEVQRHKRKAPGSTELPITSANNEMHSENITDMDFEEPSLPEKVRGTGISNGRVTPDPDTEADAPKDNDHSEDIDPRTLRSQAEIPRAPVAEEEDLHEDDGEEGGDVTAATADPDRDVRENLMKPEATVNNNTIPPDEGKHEDADGRGKICRKKSFPFFNKMKKKDVKQETNQPAHQLEPLLNKMDNMVDEKCLDFVAGQMKLKKLDKLCRELGLKDTQVTNYRYELELQHVHGAELAFQMLVKIRESLGVKFTYRRLDRALRESKNVHVADEMIWRFVLE